MLAEVLIGVTPITLLCVAVVLVPTKLFLSRPWSWMRAAVVSSAVAALGAGATFSVLARIFAEKIGPAAGLAASGFSAVQALLLVWILAAASRLMR